jgi:L-ribulose-5-phosphate 3-epimerase
MARIGIMQGRLVPPTGGRIQCFPRDRWEEEFPLAAKAGLDCIELTYDTCGADAHPLATDSAMARMKALSAQSGVEVRSLCADYFMEEPLVRATPADLEGRLAALDWLMQRCQLAGLNRLVLPFVDASRIETDTEFDAVCSVLERALGMAESTAVEIHLETSLRPDRFAELLARLPHPMLKVNYDSGNSASLGYPPAEEFASYGARVGSVHIKDRMLGGSTVPLGTGNADFGALSRCLEEVCYAGDFILQVARGATGRELEWASQNRDFVRQRVMAQR